MKNMPFYYDRVLQERIWLTDTENKIIQLNRFEKLKKIKQNGFSYLIYPDATNNRYDHSIGTLYWITKLYSSIYNYEGKSIIENDDLVSLRLAALIHDVGHGPFSHCLEELVYRNASWSQQSPWSDYIKKYKNTSPHELITLEYLNSIEFEECINNEIIYTKIKDILNKKSDLYILLSGDLDADRIDYLIRDSHYSGLPFGYNIKVIFNELLDKNLRLLKKDGKSRLIVDIKGLSAFEQFLLARYSHYKYIAYEPEIQVANLYFITELESLLLKYLKTEDKIALFLDQIFKKISDEELLDLNFYNITNDNFQKEIKLMNSDEEYKTKFIYLKQNINNLYHYNLRIVNLGKKLAYNIMKESTFLQLKTIEDILQKSLETEIKLSCCMPSALTVNACIDDKDVDPRYAPSFAYDHSPLIQGLEQKMYQDVGITIISLKEIDSFKIISILNTLDRKTADFDYYTYGIIKYIEEVPKLFYEKQIKWELRRARIFDFINYLYEKLNTLKKIKNKINFDIPYYNKDVYDIIQKLEFLDVINEDYNLKHGMGSFIPTYKYLLGEYSEEIKTVINLSDVDKKIVEDTVQEYFYIKRGMWM